MRYEIPSFLHYVRPPEPRYSYVLTGGSDQRIDFRPGRATGGLSRGIQIGCDVRRLRPVHVVGVVEARSPRLTLTTLFRFLLSKGQRGWPTSTMLP